MTSSSSILKISRGLFTRLYDWQYDAIAPALSKSEISKILADLKPLLDTGTVLKNIKGRDAANVISEGLSLAVDQELLSFTVEWIPAEFGVQDDEAAKARICSYTLATPFDRFEGKDIFHKVTELIAGEAPPDFSKESVLKDERLKLNSFRLGLDFFSQSKIASWFVSTPIVQQSILIESDGKECKLRILSEGNKKAEDQLHTQAELAQSVLSEISLNSTSNVLSDLKSKFQQQYK